LPPWVKTVAEFLRLTPMLRTTADGRIATGHFFVGKRHRIRKFARLVARQNREYPSLNIAIAHAVCPEDAAQLERLLRGMIPKIERLSVTKLGAALGVHGGPGTLLVAAQPSTRVPKVRTR
jgi:fatty acid-binding protein DegV